MSSFGEPMTRVDAGDAAPFDFWDYFDAILAADFEGHDCSAAEVERVYREPCGRYEHVLVRSENRNIFMVLVLDLKDKVVYGHRLLDLNGEYGLDAEGRPI
jgi:hypothetical protein